MKFLPLVWRNLMRRKIRTILTMLSIFMAFLLFGVLMAMRAAFSMGVELAGADRLMTIHKVSLIQLLPKSYGERIRADRRASPTSRTRTGSAATTRSRRNFIANMAVDPETLAAHVSGVRAARGPEEGVDCRSRPARSSASTPAKKFDWKVGDRVPLDLADLPQARRNAVGIHDRRHLRFVQPRASTRPSSSSTRTTSTRRSATRPVADQVGLVHHRVADPRRRTSSPSAIDAMFANSPAETKTATEKAFVSDFAKQVGDIGAIMMAIAAVVMFFILFVAGNTMAQSIRERTNELAC